MPPRSAESNVAKPAEPAARQQLDLQSPPVPGGETAARDVAGGGSDAADRAQQPPRGPPAGARGPVQQVRGGHLALGLHEHAADLRQARRHVLRDLVLGGDGVPEVVGAPGEDGRLTQGDVAAHELLHDLLTSMATSGHMRAQLRQALQPLSSSKAATK